MLITTLVNALSNVNRSIYSNHIRFFVYTAKTDPSIEFDFFTPNRMAIDTARNTTAKIALETESDYVLFIDDDVLIPKDALFQLLKADKDIVAGNVVIRGYPFNEMAFKYVEQHKLTFYNDLPLAEPCKQAHINFDMECDDCYEAPLQPLVEVGAVGFSCCLIKTSILKQMEPPYFVTGLNHTEDIYFCVKCRELTPIPTIWLNNFVQCGHVLDGEPVEWATRRKMRDFYKPKAELNYERNLDHIKMNLVKLGA